MTFEKLPEIPPEAAALMSQASSEDGTPGVLAGTTPVADAATAEKTNLQVAGKATQIRLGREAAEKLRAMPKSQLLVELQVVARTLWASVPWTHEHLRGDEVPSELAALAHDVIHALLREQDKLLFEIGRLQGEVAMREKMLEALLWGQRQNTDPRATPKLGDPDHPDGPGPGAEGEPS